jgi:hypothetical protein
MHAPVAIEVHDITQGGHCRTGREGWLRARQKPGSRSGAELPPEAGLPTTKNRTQPIAPSATPKSAWKAAMGMPMARRKSVATPHPAKKWRG